MNPDESEEKDANTELRTLNPDQLVAKLRSLEDDLDYVREQRRIDLARPMRGVEREALTRQLDRHEARVRGEIEAVKALLQEN